jgi:hypothetical protein
MKSTAIELARFKLKPGISDAVFNGMIQQTNALLLTYPGFVSRSLGSASEDEYFDIVMWEDMESAVHAANTFGKDDGAKSFIEAIDFTWQESWLKHLSLVGGVTLR